MKTPIFDAVKAYSEKSAVRAHMPGHKGREMLGIEKYDLTEIDGLDVLYSADGVILESENNASELFCTEHTYYSAEGSTLAIKAMLAIAITAEKSDTTPTVLAARNVHRAFVSAAALLDFKPTWLMGEGEHLCDGTVTPSDVRRALSEMERKPAAVYITSPDYLGNILDVQGIARVCDEYSVPLLVDNAHGAYLAFLEPSRHPIALGAAMCADSAHKTLPALTGAAYLHISKKYSHYTKWARSYLSLFASTSPSYLILSSLDLTNAYISDGYRDKLSTFISRLDGVRERLNIRRCEPLKLVLDGSHSDALRDMGIECEFCDRDFTVLMLTPENDSELDKIESAISSLDLNTKRETKKISLSYPIEEMTVREASFSDFEEIDASEAEGRICASLTVSCPPAVPIAISGEKITGEHIFLFERYGAKKIKVVK